MEPRPQSIRLSIVHQALTDIVERLSELPLTQDVRELRIQAAAYTRLVRAWDATPPSDDTRSEMMSKLIELNMKVIAVGRTEP
jgi:transcriptional regulator CtsR